MKKVISIVLSVMFLCLAASSVSINVIADQSCLKANKYTFAYGKYFGTVEEEYFWLNKNNTFKYQDSYGSRTGKWKLKKYNSNYYIDLYNSKGEDLYLSLNLTEGNNRLYSIGTDTIGCSAYYYKLPDKVKNVKLKKGKNYVKVSWSKTNWSILPESERNIGYEIQYSTDKKFKSKEIVRCYSGKTTSVKIYNLKKNKKYYFRVRSFHVNERYFCKVNSDYLDNSAIIYNGFSTVSSIKTPSKCSLTKKITKTQAENKVKNIKTYNCYSAEYIKSVKVYGKSYYLVMGNWSYTTYLGNGEYMPHYRQTYFLVSYDGKEIVEAKLEYYKNYYNLNQKYLCIAITM